MSKDIIRQISNLILAPAMWLCSSLGFIFESARSPSDMSNANSSLLVPAGVAFSIWFPIFVLCTVYGVMQALPKNRTHEVFRKIGGWSAAGFAGVCLWGIVNAFAPMQPFDWAQWGTAFIFVPTMLVLVKAMLIATAEKENMSSSERYTAWLGLSLIAGWCSIAMFLNWAPQIVGALMKAGIDQSFANIIMLNPALYWAVFISLKSRNLAYAFPIVWGLVFVVVARFTETPSHPLVGAAAAGGALIVLISALLKRK